MPVQREVYRTIASAEISDDYGVILRTRKRRKHHLTADEAESIAEELMEAATVARRVRIHDSVDEMRAIDEAHAASHGFDVAPVCRECQEGKHGACNGDAVVEVRDEVETHPCGCHAVDHRVYGSDQVFGSGS